MTGNLSFNLDLGQYKMAEFKVTNCPTYKSLSIHGGEITLGLYMSEDQMIKLIKVLQNHFMERAGFVPPELTPGEVITLEDYNEYKSEVGED